MKKLLLVAFIFCLTFNSNAQHYNSKGERIMRESDQFYKTIEYINTKLAQETTEPGYKVKYSEHNIKVEGRNNCRLIYTANYILKGKVLKDSQGTTITNPNNENYHGELIERTTGNGGLRYYRLEVDLINLNPASRFNNGGYSYFSTHKNNQINTSWKQSEIPDLSYGKTQFSIHCNSDDSADRVGKAITWLVEYCGGGVIIEMY